MDLFIWMYQFVAQPNSLVTGMAVPAHQLPSLWLGGCMLHLQNPHFHRRYPACLCKGNNVKWSFLFNTNLFHLTLESEMWYRVSTQNRSL